MPTTASEQVLEFDLSQDAATLQRDGVVGLKGGLSRAWVDRLHDDMMTAFWDSIQRPGGAVGRGPRRWYVELHPEALSGFVDFATHPWITAMAEAVLGQDWQIVEVGFDTPFQGARNQPWHRDFPSPPDSYADHRITSLAFNVTGVDVTPGHGTVRDRAGYPVGRWPRLGARDVPPGGQRGSASRNAACASSRRGATSPAARRSPCIAAPRIRRRSRARCWCSASTRPAPGMPRCTT